MWQRIFSPAFLRVPLKVRIDPAVYIFAAFGMLAIPMEWIAGWIGAAVFHELGHILAVRLFGGKVDSIHLRLQGALISAEDMGTYKNIAASLAGPVVGLVPLLFARRLPRMALCAAAFSACNLLPLSPLDGGRALRALGETHILFGIIGKLLEWILAAGLVFAAVCFRSYLPAVLLIPFLREKYLAKRQKKGYNSATIEMR